MLKKLIGAGVVVALVAVVLVGVGASTASAQTMSLCQTVDALVAAGVIAPDKVAAAKAAAGCGATASASYTFTRDLTVGSTGADVTALQNMLGVSPATGYFGSITKAAVVAYQTSKGISATGYVGPLTRAALNTPVVVVPTTPVTPATPAASNDLEGGAGDITVTSITTDVEDTVLEGATEKVLGFKIEATDSDVAIKNMKLSLVNQDASGSYRLSRYADSVDVYMGSTKVGSVDVADFVKESGTTTYSRSVSLSDAIVREGANKKATFYVKVNALSNIDSDDIANNNWNLEVSNIRYTDATGAILTSNDTVDSNFTFSDLSTSGDVTLTVSKGTSSPSADSVTVSDTGSTPDVLMLEFKMKAKGSDLSFDSLDVSIATTSVGTSTISAMLGELTLKNGSDELASVSSFDNDGADTVTFDLDDSFIISDGDTETFRVYAKINDSDNFTSGDGLSVSFNDIAAEDENGDVVTETGSANGEAQSFVIDVPTVSLVGTPTLAVYTHTDGTTSGLEDLYKATVVFNVTAPDSNDVYLPLDTFNYGTAGTRGVEYTVTGSATVTSAALAYSGTTSNVEQDNSVLVSAGETEKFTLTVYLTGNDAQGKVTVDSVWYEISDVTPNGTPEITTGLTNFKTPLTLLAK